MKTIYFALLFSLIHVSIFAQCCPYMNAFEISPAVPCSNQETHLLTTVTTPNLGQYFGYEIQQNGNTFTITACYSQGFLTLLETFNEVVDLGILPVGTYEYEYIALLSEMTDTTECFTTIYDQNQVVGNFTVIDCGNPDDVQAEFLIGDISCFGVNDGSIQINATGGIPPYQYSIDGVNFQMSPDFLNLAAGEYNVTIMDADGVYTFQNLIIEEALEFLIDAGPDLFWELNTTYTLNAAISMPSDNVNWSPALGLSCVSCLVTEAIPPAPMCYTIAATNQNGCIAFDEICFVLPDKVEDINTFSFQIYPNPTSTFLNIELKKVEDKNFEIQLLNIKSQTVFGQTLNASNKNHQINVSDMPNGIYLIQIISNSLIYSQKFVKL